MDMDDRSNDGGKPKSPVSRTIAIRSALRLLMQILTIQRPEKQPLYRKETNTRQTAGDSGNLAMYGLPRALFAR